MTVFLILAGCSPRAKLTVQPDEHPMYAILDTRTGDLLRAMPIIERKYYDWEEPCDYPALSVGTHGDTVFVTTSKRTAYLLVKTGRCDSYPEVVIASGYDRSTLQVIKIVKKKVGGSVLRKSKPEYERRSDVRQPVQDDAAKSPPTS